MSKIEELVRSINRDAAMLASLADPATTNVTSLLMELDAARREMDAVTYRYLRMDRLFGGYVNEQHEREWRAAMSRHDSAVSALEKYAATLGGVTL